MICRLIDIKIEWKKVLILGWICSRMIITVWQGNCDEYPQRAGKSVSKSHFMVDWLKWSSIFETIVKLLNTTESLSRIRLNHSAFYLFDFYHFVGFPRTNSDWLPKHIFTITSLHRSMAQLLTTLSIKTAKCSNALLFGICIMNIDGSRLSKYHPALVVVDTEEKMIWLCEAIDMKWIAIAYCGCDPYSSQTLSFLLHRNGNGREDTEKWCRLLAISTNCMGKQSQKLRAKPRNRRNKKIKWTTENLQFSRIFITFVIRSNRHAAAFHCPLKQRYDINENDEKERLVFDCTVIYR